MPIRRRRLMTTCPATGRLVPTHMVEREAHLRRTSGRLVYWCPACGETHGVDMHRGELKIGRVSFGGEPRVTWVAERA